MKKSVKKTLCMALVLVLLVGMIPMAHAANPFTDVPGNAWYAPYVDYAYNHNLMAGTSASTFSPNQNMTRGMLVTVLHSIAGKPSHSGKNPFSDVGSSWYTNAVVWCYEHKIVAGTSATTFSPNAPVTREQMVAIMFKFAAANGLNTSDRANLSGYGDYNSISTYAKDAFSWAVAKGVISGTSSTTLSPKGKATRAQCATILQRYHELLNNIPTPPAPTTPAPTEPTPTTPAPTEPTPTEPTPPTPPVHVIPPIKTPADKGFPYVDNTEAIKREISQWAVHYINEYRKEEGSPTAEPLVGMNLVAEFRADQLTVNYGHIEKDKRIATKYYKYGTYEDLSYIPGFSEADNYYAIDGGEAILEGSPVGNGYTTKMIGERIAKTFRNSPNHWSYVGNKEPGVNYAYIGVGVEFDEDGAIYCCVSVSATNHDIGWVNPHP